MTVLLFTLPASAWAAGGSPLHVDPSSPVAKAYALPLGSARATSGPDGRSKLFGSGLRRIGTPGASSGTMAARLRGRGVPAAYRVLEPGPGSGLVWMGLFVVVVLGLGAGGARALRRFR